MLRARACVHQQFSNQHMRDASWTPGRLVQASRRAPTPLAVVHAVLSAAGLGSREAGAEVGKLDADAAIAICRLGT